MYHFNSFLKIDLLSTKIIAVGSYYIWHAVCLLTSEPQEEVPPSGDIASTEGTNMKSMTVYDSLLPTFGNVFKADPIAILDSIFDGEYFQTIAARSPVVDVREKKDAYLIEAELPGVSEKDLKLELKDGLLTLSTEKKEESQDKAEDGKWIRRERRERYFTRNFELPEDADGEKIEARFKDGLLTVEVPKKPETSPRLVPVKAA
jgi:HSP20 family protein